MVHRYGICKLIITPEKFEYPHQYIFFQFKRRLGTKKYWFATNYDKTAKEYHYLLMAFLIKRTNGRSYEISPVM